MAAADVQTVAGVKMMVKNTFLEVAEVEEQPQMWRSKTVPAAVKDAAWSCSSDSDVESEGSAMCAQPSVSIASDSTTSWPEPAGPEPVAALRMQGNAPPAVAGASAKLAGVTGREERPQRQGAADSGEKRSHGDSAQRTKSAGQGLTTVMLRNLPNDYTRRMLQRLLAKRGFALRYDFLYLPIDFTRKSGLGYGFVNMLSAADAKELRRSLDGFQQWSIRSQKVCRVGWSDPSQGLAANIERYRNNPVMHDSVPDEYKPILLEDGERIPFPVPTVAIRRPMLRNGGQ